MFSRIKDALDRSLAEEQVRHRSLTEQRRANRSSNDAVTSPSTDPARNPGSTHPDPAVFEAAIRPDDDLNSTSGSATPKSSLLDDNTKGPANNAISEKNSEAQAQAQDSDTKTPASTDASQPPELPPQVKSKLQRLQKLENVHQEVLQSYRIAHSQIKNFERALQENTPLSTIRDPAALMEYINQFNLKNDMALQELRRVSAQKDDFKKETAILKAEIFALKNADKVPEEINEREDMFSYDDEIPKLQTELASKTEHVTKLELQIKTLEEDLAAAKEQGAITSQKAQHEPSELGDDTPAQPEPDGRDVEIKLLKETLKDGQQQLRDNEASLEKERSLHFARAAEVELLEAALISKNAEFERLTKEAAEMTKQIAGLHRQFEEYGKTDATKEQLGSAPKPVEATAPMNSSTKKKNKKKKKGGAPQTTSETTDNETPKLLDSSITSLNEESMNAELLKLREVLAVQQGQYSQMVQDLGNRGEEIAMLRDSLIETGEDATKAKREIKELEEQIAELQATNSELEKRVEDLTAYETQVADMKKQMKLVAANTTASASKQKAELESTKKELEELKIRSSTLQSDLGASQTLAQDRFKELTTFKEILSKAQAEMKILRQDSSNLKTTRQELVSKQNELRAVEKREKELKNELGRVQRLSSDRESEIKLLNDRLSAEKTSRAKLEDENRVLGRDYRRLEAKKVEISAKAERLVEDLEGVEFELSSLRPKVELLEDEVAKLQKEKDLAKEEVDLKTQQYHNAQGLLASMRAEHKELETQLKEAQNQVESLQEELAEAHKHLAERTRETETMRRRIKEENDKADARVSDMKARMESAIEDRDRFEDEASTVGRQRAREAEDLKSKVRELERESKALKTEKDALEASEQQWRQRREELAQIEEKTTAETEDMRSTISGLQSALEASEQQVHDAEKQKANLRKLLDEAQGRYEKANKELKTVQAKLAPGNGSNVTRSRGPSTSSVNGGADITYVKTVFQQFLDADDARVRLHLIPVILKLLGFDKNEEEKGAKTLQHLLGSNRK